MDLRKFYSDATIQTLVGKYLDTESVARRFAKSAEDLTATECLIPVLGTQGSGKSSFLNAVLFGDILLPVDADETTCIPTAIRYGENEKPEAYVVLSSGVKKKVPCTEAGLADYVHQEKNPGNTKGISCIEIVLKNDLLKDGIVFVDLPGVGSITAANQKTTTEYLQKCTAAIFMLRTVPPITQSESVFIQGALPLMGRVFWVQNQWTDESKDEVNEGRSHNHKVIQDVAARLNLPKSSVAEPSVVCVKRALDGRVSGDAKTVEKSGINAFRDAVVAFAHDWRKEIFAGKKADGLLMLAAAAEVASKRHAQLLGDADIERAKIAEEKKRTEAILDNNSKLVRDVRDFLDDRETSINKLILDECQKCVENVRNGVRETIDNGVVGGSQLNRAFNDYVDRGSEEVFNAIQPVMLDVANEVSRMLSGLKDCSEPFSKNFKSHEKNAFSDKTKVHATYKLAGGIAGGVGGFFAGIKVGAAVGTWIGGPAGTVIGAVAGAVTTMLAGIFGSLCGSKARDIHLEQQKETARSELFEAASRYSEKLKKNYIAAYAEFSGELQSRIRDWLREQKDVVEAKYRKAVVDLSKPADEKAAEAENAKRDAERLTSLRKELEAI